MLELSRRQVRWKMAAIFLFLAIPDCLVADGAEDLWKRAAETFHQASLQDPRENRKGFHRSAEMFRELAGKGYRSPGLFFNLGNAEYLAGRLPWAIRAYRQGLDLDPQHAGLRRNLELARQQVDYPAHSLADPEMDDWPGWLPRPSSHLLFALAFVFQLLFCAVLAWFHRQGYLRGQMLSLLFLLAAIASAAGWWSIENRKDWEARHPVVVIAAEEVGFYQGNGFSFPLNPQLSHLRAGMEARRVHQRGGWLQIQLSSGLLGWVPLSVVLSEAEAPASNRE